jgi:Do/DeqQ family serine protease
MRRLLSLLSLALAAVFGGLTAYWLQARTAEAPAAPPPLARAAELVLPAPVQAAVPAAVDGVPVPSLAPMLERVTPAVVNIYTRQVVRSRARSPLEQLFGLPGMSRDRVQQSLGSGVIVDAERGLVLTNNHVIEGAQQVSVTLADGRTLEAQPVGSDPDTDIAVIRIPPERLTALPLADSSQLRVGDFVVAVGNPYGLEQTVTSGIVSALGRSGLQGLGYQNFIQTDASINPGNSGGALVNLRGELVGINTAIFSRDGGSVGIGFAIPTSLAREVMRQLMAYGEVRRGSLGLDSSDVDAETARANGLPAPRGALISRIYRGSPAEAAGLQPGDVVVAANGQAIANGQGLRNVEGLLPVGQPVRLEVLRDGRRLSLQATLRPPPSEILGADLDARLAGATVAELPERFRAQGLNGAVISAVERGSRAERNGLQPGDLILAVNRRQVGDLAGLRGAIAGNPTNLLLYLKRGMAQGELRMR